MYLCGVESINHQVMLGFETRRDPIRGEFARRIREQLLRAHSPESLPSGGTSSQEESLPKYHAVWR